MKKHEIFYTKKYEYLAKEISNLIKMPLGAKEFKNFPDGERYIRIIESCLNKDIIIVGGTISDSDTLEIYDMACAFAKYGANSLTLIIPYFGYSTMERAVKNGEIVPAKTRARLLSSIPKTPKGNKILLLDLHSEGIPYYFENDVQVFHLYSKNVLMNHMKMTENDFVLASTDAGRAKWVESLAKDLGVQPAFVYKQRISGETTEITGVNANVKGKTVIIYDDMIRTGNSLINAAKAYKHAGATKIYAYTTHGLFPEFQGIQSIEKIKETKLFTEIFSSNSHPNALQLKDNCFSIASVFVDFLKRSIS